MILASLIVALELNRSARKKTAREAPAPPVTLEEALVKRAVRGDQRAFGQLHQRYAPMVHAIALSRVPPHEVDDVVQEAFLKAWQRLPKLRERGRFGPWLATLTRNLITDHHRKRKPHVAMPPDVQALHRPSAEAAEIVRHIRAMPETYREVLIMRLVEGMSGPEIAARTGMTSGSVRVNLHRGMKRLRARLGLEDTR